MADFRTQLNNINTERTNLDKQERALLALQLQAQKGKTIAAATLKAAKTLVSTAKTQLQTQVNALHQGQTLDNLVANWEADVPLLMLPVRIQTRLSGLQTPVNGGFFELLVRIYPDDLYTCGHEDVLTDAEVEAGKNYWFAIRKAEQTNVVPTDALAQKKEAWRQLTARFGGPRSLYISRVTMPTNRASLSQLTTDAAMLFNVNAWADTKRQSWTKAAKTNILPDRFQVSVYKSADANAAPFSVKDGNLVSDTLQLGLDPLNESGNIGKKNGEVTVGEELKWITDFAEAERVGMGIRVPLPLNFYLPPQGPIAPTQPQGQAFYLTAIGIPRIVVLGTWTSADKMKSANALQQFFDSHLYTPKGMSFLPIGAPTNNTDNNESAFSRANDPLSMDFFDGFKSFPDADTTADGARLAKALGVPKAVFQVDKNAAKKDAEVARQMNSVLYSATIGYYCNELLRDAAFDRVELQNFVQQFLIGNGQFSALRIGSQPYGIALSGGRTNNKPFFQGLNNVLDNLRNQIWQPLSIKTPRVGNTKNPEQTLVDILSLHPNSIEFDQEWFYPTSPATQGKVGGFNFKQAENRSLIVGFLRGLGYRGNNPMVGNLVNHTIKITDEIPTTNLIKNAPFDQDDLLNTGRFNYLQWLSTLKSIRDLETLPLDGFVGLTRTDLTPVLFLMVRHAFLQQFAEAFEQLISLNIFKEADKSKVSDLSGKITALRDLGTQFPIEVFNITPKVPKATLWEVFQASVPFDDTEGSVTARFSAQFKDKPLSDAVLDTAFLSAIVAAFQSSPNPLLQTSLRPIKNFLNFRKSLALLSIMPAAALERAFIGHLDCAAHRLDAWHEAAIAHRLEQNRSRTPDGIYIGAFGWVEDLKITNQAAITEGGYIHAPSPAHATTAAVMKSAFLNHKQPSNQSAFALNLPSQRLQRAQQVVERLKNDERLEAILGYQFERELQDSSANQGTIAANFIRNFRDRYPIMALNVPQNPTEAPTPIATSRNLVNGLQLAEEFIFNPQTWKRGLQLDGMPINSDIEKRLAKAISNIVDTLDAVKDLLSAETAFRMAQGNLDAVGATLDALNKGSLPNEIGFTESARQPLFQFSNRVAVHFNTEGVVSNFPESPRARTEAGLNVWCTELLGQAQNIGFVIRLSEQTGTANTAKPLTINDLNIQILDLVCLSANPAELEARIFFAIRKKFNLADDAAFTVSFAETGSATIRPLADILPIATTLQRLISTARPLNALDYLPSGVAMPPSVIEASELRGRIELIINQLNQILTAIDTTNLSEQQLLEGETTTLANLGDVFKALKKTKHDATADTWLPQVLVNVSGLQSLMIQLSNFGISQSFPSKNGVNAPEIIRLMVRQAATVVETTRLMLTEVTTGLANLSTDNPLSMMEDLMRFGKQVFSGTLPMLPRFRYVNADQILDSKNRRDELLKGAITDPTPANMKAEEWLQGAARVRPKLAQWETLRFMTAANAPLDLAPVQVPTDALTLRKPDGSRQPIYTWVATEFTEGVQLQREVLSIVVTGEAAANKTQALQTGLLLDEWTETIPTDEELTALTFHYNQPNTEAPQTLILAVCPDVKWSAAAILNAVTDTLNRAKMRTVTLEHIRKEAAAGAMPFKAAAQMLPMLVAPVNVQQHSFSLDFGVANKNSLNRTTGLADEVPMGHYLIWKENV